MGELRACDNPDCPVCEARGLTKIKRFNDGKPLKLSREIREKHECHTCRHWEASSYRCRRGRPEVDKGGWAYWPRVSEKDAEVGCGEWEGKC